MRALEWVLLIGWVPCLIGQSAIGGAPQEDEASRVPAVRAFVMASTTKEALQAESWLVDQRGGQIPWTSVMAKARREPGGNLHLTLWHGRQGYENNTIVLTFLPGLDDLHPAVEATVAWNCCVVPFTRLESIEGDVLIRVAGSMQAATKELWNGSTPARIRFSLHGTARGRADCVHGEFFFDPEQVIDESAADGELEKK